MINSGLVSPGSVDGVLSGKEYNRALRAYKILMETLERLRFDAFMQSCPQIDDEFRDFFESMGDAFPDTQFLDYVQSPQMDALFDQYSGYVRKMSQENSTFSFWSSFIAMVQLLLLFIRATRANDWPLHLSTIRSMLPWFFAYDRINYQRYLTAYWLEMILLDRTHPGNIELFSLRVSRSCVFSMKLILKCGIHQIRQLLMH